jgi:hypothetical protein
MFKGATAVPDAQPLTFKGATPVTEAPAAPARVKKTREEIQAETDADMARMADPSAGMNWAEKGLVGIGAGFANVGRGVRSLANKAGLLDEGAQAELKADQETRDIYEKYHPGGWATAGEVVGEGLATAPIGGAVGMGGKLATTVAGKVLPKAVPALTRFGGSVAGAVGRGAAEGAISNVVTGPEDQSVLKNALTGGAWGGGGTAALKVGGKAAEGVQQVFSSTARAKGALEKSLGKEGLREAAERVSQTPAGALPQTTAALAGSPELGRLERGARSRGTADFLAHDKAVDKAAWDQLHKITEVPGGVENLKGQPNAIYAEGQRILDKLPLSQNNRAAISTEVAKLRNHNEVIANPELGREIDRILGAVDNPNATLGVLPQLYTSLDASAAGSSAIREAKKIIKTVADDRSKGQFSNVLEGYGATKDAVRAAEKAQGLRGVYAGEAGLGEVPAMKSKPLQKGLEKALPDLDPETAAKANQLAGGLRNREIYKAANSPGATELKSKGAGIVGAIAMAIPSWKVRMAIKSSLSGLDETATRKVDEALLNPQEFLKMVGKKRASGKALVPWEEAVDEGLRGTVRGLAIEE